ncbi:hypothetical protein EBT16_03675 [bacterium]|nr:hypothetical protein [bacterium]
MLKKNLISLPIDKEKWVKDSFGSFSSLVQDERHEPPIWGLSVCDQQKSGGLSGVKYPSGISVGLEGGPGRCVFRKAEREIRPLESWKWNSESGFQLYLVSPLRCFHLGFDEGLAKAAIYPAYLNATEELQFPIVGSEHFIYMVSGTAIWLDRESDESRLLKSGDLLHVSRIDRKREYLNLKLKGDGARSIALWAVLHYLADHK